MLDSNESNQRATAYERVVAKQFEKLGYVVERLDSKSSKRPRPDFLIKDRRGYPQMLCEVKTISSAGYLPDKGFHMSMLDENLGGFQLFRTDVDLRNINDDLSDAGRKRSALVEDKPKYERLPMVVAFFFDFFANFLRFYPRTFDENISGILTIKIDAARIKAYDELKLSIEEQERRLKSGDMSGLPPESKDFVLVRNKAARRVVPKDFQLRCITEGYDESLD